MALNHPTSPKRALSAVKVERGVFALGIVLLLAMPAMLRNAYYMQIATMVLIYAGLMIALNICIGYAGLVSVAHGAIFGVGAYTTGLLMTNHGWGFWASLPVSAMLGAVLGLALGALTLRLKGHYFVIAALGFGLLLYLLVLNWRTVTGGSLGVGPIATYDSVLGLDFDNSTSIYYLILFFFALFMGVMLWVRHSSVGKRLEAIRQNERLASAVGIDPARARLVALLLSAAVAALAGSLYAPYVGFLDPSVGALDASFKQALALVIAGLGTVAGPLVAAIVYVALPEALRGVEQYSLIALGVLLLLVVRFAPYGIVGGSARVFERFVAKRANQPRSRSKNSSGNSEIDTAGGAHD